MAKKKKVSKLNSQGDPFQHICDEEKISKKYCQKSLREANFNAEELEKIWDFYVTHVIAGNSGLSRKLTDYGWNDKDGGKYGYNILAKRLAEVANIDEICFVHSNSIANTLAEMDLLEDAICVKHPRAVVMCKFSCGLDENEEFWKRCTPGIKELFRHIRNSLAHGNVYIFKNGNMLLEDRDKDIITAEILISQSTLLEWIDVIENEGNSKSKG